MKKLLLLLALASVLAACGKSAGTKFEGGGVSFTCPKGWEIIEDDDMGVARFISVEKSGRGESGIIVLTWLYGGLGKEEYMDIYKGQMDGQPEYTSLVFEDIPGACFNGTPAIGVSYAAQVEGMPYSGKLFTFEQGDRVFCVNFQGADGDAAKNKSGFQAMEKSFSME